MVKNILIAILLLGCIALTVRSCQNTKAGESLALSLVNKERVIQGSIKQLKKLNITNDSLLLALQKSATKHTTSITVVKQVVHDTIYLSGPTITKWELVNDTLYPTYTDTYKDKWTTIEATMSRNNSMFIYSITNDITVKQEYKRDGIFKPRYMAVSIENTNPHVVSVDYRSFQVAAPKRNRLLWYGLGLASGVGLMLAK